MDLTAIPPSLPPKQESDRSGAIQTIGEYASVALEEAIANPGPSNERVTFASAALGRRPSAFLRLSGPPTTSLSTCCSVSKDSSSSESRTLSKDRGGLSSSVPLLGPPAFGLELSEVEVHHTATVLTHQLRPV